jgi:ABC-type antimicrobial peptide transport system permease subunit
VTDVDGIKTFIYHIERISADGDEMRSFIAKETIELSFDCGEKKVKIQIFDGWFKTPNTAFNSSAKVRKVEESLHDAIVSTLRPDLKKKMLKFVNNELKFKDFSLTYKGSTHFDYAPATISGNDEQFEVKDKAGKVQTLTVTSGQLPPQPTPFTVNGQKLVLETFNSPTYGPIIGFLEIHP